jgi:hypothetical protein
LSSGRVLQIQSRRGDGGIVTDDRTLVLLNERRLSVQLLMRDGVLGNQTFIAFEVDPRVGKQRLVTP